MCECVCVCEYLNVRLCTFLYLVYMGFIRLRHDSQIMLIIWEYWLFSVVCTGVGEARNYFAGITSTAIGRSKNRTLGCAAQTLNSTSMQLAPTYYLSSNFFCISISWLYFSALVELTLSANPRISAQGWARLSMAVANCTSLRMLMLDYNPLGDYGAACLLVAVSAIQNMEILDLEGCGLTEHTAQVCSPVS